MPAPVENIAGYLFTPLLDLETRVVHLRLLCERLSLKGTILLAPEGINLFLAGSSAQIDAFLSELKTDAAFHALAVKISYSETPPFLRLKVKLKQEIVPLGVNNLDPNRSPAPRMSSAELKRWLDEGRKFILLDTRNRFEFNHGTFDGAIDLNIEKFRDLPDAVQQQRVALENLPIVTFCTGGIRCEKAAPLLQKMGFSEVYQLDGGILKYFEEQGHAHYHGSCFVFDERIGLDGDLSPIDAVQSELL
jgi:UPF0176 protein